MRRILSVVDLVSTWVGKGVSVLTLFVALAIVYEIFMRYAFVKPTVWASESTAFACGLVYLLGGAWTLLEDKHVRIDMVYAKVSPRGRAALDCFTYLFFAFYIAVMLQATAIYAYESAALRETTMTPWDPPIYPMKVAMTVALALLLLQGTAKFIRNLYFLVTGKTL
jgi:TRAP-type mannitol/chloroaromatic compound transport system permease small subunit